LNEDMQTTMQRSSRQVDWLMLMFWGTVLFAFCLRFYDLGSKPFHHDESLYSVYCGYFFKGDGYKYDPMMHGPFLFLFQSLIFFFFGVSDFSARIAPALFGSLMVAITYYLKEYLGKIGVLTVALLLTFSPTHLYFSRFMREDIYVAFFIYAAAIFGFLYFRTYHKQYLYLAAAFLSLMFCEKENSYIQAFILLTFLFIKDFCQTYLFHTAKTMDKKTLIGWITVACTTLVFAAVLIFFSKEGRELPAVVARIPKHNWAVLLLVVTQLCVGGGVVLYLIKDAMRRSQSDLFRGEHIYRIILGVFIFVWIYIVLYSTFLMHPKGVFDGLAQSWIYWWHQNRIQRIKGPFHYYVSFILLYELPAFLIAAGGVLHNISSTVNRKIIAGWAVIFSGILILYFGKQSLPSWLGFTHMEFGLDLTLTIAISGIGLWATLHFLHQRNTFAAFWTYSSAIGFLIYSYAGEKVPWLFLHILVPVILLAGFLVNQLFTSAFWCERQQAFQIVRVVVVVVGVLFGAYTFHSTVLLNYYNPANPVETMVYTQTSTDVLKVLAILQDVKFKIGAEAAKQPIIAVQGNATWPMAWYLRDEPGWFFPNNLSQQNQRPLVLIDWEDREKYQQLFAMDYQEIRIKLREWWIPDPGKGFADWWKYFLHRKIFNPTGSTDVAFYVRKQIAE
jgi:uncharacterized protein (TIGR03663 family)